VGHKGAPGVTTVGVVGVSGLGALPPPLRHSREGGNLSKPAKLRVSAIVQCLAAWPIGLVPGTHLATSVNFEILVKGRPASPYDAGYKPHAQPINGSSGQARG